jgi:uracil phosphoribosyltransferase
MWEFLLEVFKAHGLLAVVQVLEAVLIVYFLRDARQKSERFQKIIEQKDAKIDKLANQRLEDVKESKEDYEDLLRDTNRSLDTVIRVVNRD